MADRRIVFAAVAVKILLIPSYVSTDFEVHRHWLALTTSLNYREWYFDVTSKWTLDYPPFFAWFECILGHIALFGASIINLVKSAIAFILCFCLGDLGYRCPPKSHYYFKTPPFLNVNEGLELADYDTRLFQKFSVILTDFVLVFAVMSFAAALPQDRARWRILQVLTICSPLLFLIDHIHFQYNGFLLGILVFSISQIFKSRDDLAALIFSSLLNLKHLFLYISPVYLIYYTRKYVVKAPNQTWESYTGSLGKMAAYTILPFAISLLPFYGQMEQIFSRLFPFKRGLLHAYWAPNVWALYACLDRVLIRVLSKIYGSEGNYVNDSVTRGIVGDVRFSVLPNIEAKTTFLLTIAFQAPILLKLWRNPSPDMFLKATILCAYCSFMFGYHVHEKAILVVLIPSYLLLYTLADGTKMRLKGWLMALTIVSGYSFFPLLLDVEETFIKFILVFGLGVFLLMWGKGRNLEGSSLTVPEKVYLIALARLALFTETASHYSIKMPFLPLMLTSVSCALANLYLFTRIYVGIYFDEILPIISDNKKDQ